MKNAAPRRSKTMPAMCPLTGCLWLNLRYKPSDRVSRPRLTASLICKKTMPTMESSTISVTPCMGALNKKRVRTSTLTMTISAKIQTVPMPFRPATMPAKPRPIACSRECGL